MIPLTRLDGRTVVINGDQVERIEAIPDTIISLNSGRKILVRESVSEVMRRIALQQERLADAMLPAMVI